MAEFDTLSGMLSGAESKEGKTKEGQRGAALRQFQAFLEKHDEEPRTFCGLRRTVFKTGEKAGTAVWTLEEARRA